MNDDVSSRTRKPVRQTGAPHRVKPAHHYKGVMWGAATEDPSKWPDFECRLIRDQTHAMLHARLESVLMHGSPPELLEDTTAKAYAVVIGRPHRFMPLQSPSYVYVSSWREAIVEPTHLTAPRDSCEEISDALRQAFDHPDPREALQQLDSLWARVEDLTSLAESRLRLLLKRAKPPALAEQPEWFGKAVAELLSDTDGSCVPHESTIASASLLVRALEAAHAGLRAHLTAMPFGAIEVSWETDLALNWLVWAPRLTWPGVHVRVYSRDKHEAPLVARTFHQAFGVIQHALDHLR